MITNENVTVESVKGELESIKLQYGSDKKALAFAYNARARKLRALLAVLKDEVAVAITEEPKP